MCATVAPPIRFVLCKRSGSLTSSAQLVSRGLLKDAFSKNRSSGGMLLGHSGRISGSKLAGSRMIASLTQVKSRA
jgi:hypothetical protein